MNYCNFAKVIISRSTKDSAAIDSFNKYDKNEKTSKTSTFIAKYNTSLSITQRFENYNIFMAKYQKLCIPSYLQFKQQCLRLQTYVTGNKYYSNNNHSGERNTFITHFSLQNWIKLNEHEKGQHMLQNCNICNISHEEASALHKSFVNNPLQKLCTELMQTASATTSKNSEKRGKQTVQKVVKTLQPVFEKTFETMNFKKTMAEALNLSPKETSVEKNKKVLASIKETNKQVESTYHSNDNDLEILLSTGKSFQQHNMERLKTSFVPKEDAEKIVKQNQLKISSGKKKCRNPIGKYDSYLFEKNTFLDEIKNFKGKIVNWTRMAKKYNVTCNDKHPANSGQVLANFARDNGIDINKFNQHVKVSGRDFVQRIRRPKRRVFRSKLSVPLQRSSKKLKEVLKSKILSQEYNIGIKIAPKELKMHKINNDGNLIEVKTQVYGRKIPLKDLLQQEMERLFSSGVVRMTTNEEYDNMTAQKVSDKLTKLGVEFDYKETLSNLLDLLKTKERTIHLKMWHDHSDILNHTYVSFMLSMIYDTANFLTNEEFQAELPTTSPKNVQTIVERPNLYIFGQSGKCNK